MKCKFCNSDAVISYKKIMSPYYQEMSYTLYECKRCLSRFFDVLQYDVSINDLYEKLSADKDNTSNGFINKQYWEDQKKILLKLLNGKPKSILDVGCGTGDFLMHFEDDIVREGVEISSCFTEIANRRGLRIYHENLENLDFSKKYDIVSAYNIIEHLSDPLRFLDKLDEIIDKKGLLAILIPSHECLKEKLVMKFRKKWHMYIPPEHLNFISKGFLDSYLRKYNFKLLKRYYSSGGLFNPFRGIPVLSAVFNKFMYYVDNSFFNRLPVFDHIYSYYIKNE